MIAEDETHALAETQLAPGVYVACKCGSRFDAFGDKGAMNKLQDHLLAEFMNRPAPTGCCGNYSPTPCHGCD